MAGKVVAVVPVRLNSRRFAGKALFPYKGKPLVLHLLADLEKSRTIDHLVVATDEERVREAVESAGYTVIMTSGKHRTGTDRVAEALQNRKFAIAINVQGDNFGLSGRWLDQVIGEMRKNKSIAFATFARKTTDPIELASPNTVKVVIAADHHALWFSRLPIPFASSTLSERDIRTTPYYAHIGVYFFRAAALRQFATWPRSIAEKVESLEQLRILEHGGRMRVFLTKARPVSIDSRDDLRKLEGTKR